MIVLDGIIFSLQRHGGISSYFRALAAGVLARRSDAQVWNYDDGEAEPTGPRVIRAPSRLLERYRDPVGVPSDAILHSSYYRASSDARANVVTVYDFMYERFADPARRFVHVRQKRDALNRADAIICISEATRRDLRQFYPRIPESKLHVVHLAAGPEFSRAAAASHTVGAAPFVLFVGKRSGYKNFAAVVNGVAAVPAMRLVCVGGGDFSARERSWLEQALSGRFEHVGSVDDTRLNALYHWALALLYPSRHEGFGIPILEAMAAGCPVITTRAGSMVEVAGDAAILLDDPGGDSIADAIRELHHAGTRAALIARGLHRAAAFSWDATVAKTLAIYESLR